MKFTAKITGIKSFPQGLRFSQAISDLEPNSLHLDYPENCISFTADTEYTSKEEMKEELKNYLLFNGMLENIEIKVEGRREDLFPEWLPNHSIEDGGDGIFIIFEEDTTPLEKDITEHFQHFFEDVQWCPDPDSHGDKAVTVLNCFYPKF